MRLVLIATGAILLSGQPSADPPPEYDRVCPDGTHAVFGYCSDTKPEPSPLERKLGELAAFPNLAPQISTPDSLEDHESNKVAEALFNILSASDSLEINKVQRVGGQLMSFKNEYYQFREGEAETERALMSEIGANVQVKFPAGWKMYLDYIVMRSGGVTPERIVSYGNYLNFGITFEDTERVYQLFLKSPSIIAPLRKNIEEYASLSRRAVEMLLEIHRNAPSANP